MKKTTSKALASAALTALIAGIIPAHQVSAASVEFQRLSGKDRYLTAIEVSKAGWVEGSEYAVVANGEAYADALSAAPFAKKNNAPILLTSSKGITKETISELKRLKVKKVYVIGETGVVPNSILEAIKKNVTNDVERIGGQDRYATSTKIAAKLGTVTEVMLASGEGYADALSAAPVAAVKGIPVLLTKAGELPKATSDYIKAQGIKKTFVVGGTASVSDKVKGLVPDAVRLGGKNRFETNAEIIKGFALDFNFDGAYIALANGVTGKEFADALTASAVAAKGGHPVIISNKTADAATTALINEKLSPTAKLTAIGGAANLSDALINGYKVKGEAIEASKNVTGNALVSKDGVALNDMKVTGNLYLEGNNAALTNVEVSGTVFVNPGAEGNATLNNVTAKKVVVLSGAQESIHFNNVTCDTLFVSSKTETRIVNDGPVDVKTVEIFSAVILDAKNAFKGTITVVDNLYVKDVQFLGKFEGAITLKGNDKIKLDGQMANVDVQGAAQIKTEAGTKVTIKITTDKAKESSKIDVPSGTQVKVEGAKEGNVTGDGASEATKPSDSGNNGGGGGGGGETAEETAVKAINNADVAGMDAAIKANATTLGLDLTDYNALKDNSSVITAMVALEGANKSTIVSTFNTAVATQKAAEALAAAKTAAKAELATEFAKYTKADYTEENWTILTNAKSAGDAAIDAAKTAAEVKTAKDNAITAMNKVEKIVVTEDVLKDTIEKTIRNYDDFKANNPDEISSYPTVVYDTNARTVTITMDEDKSTNKVSDTFNFKAKSGMVTESRLKELERLLSLTGINVGNKSLVDYIVTSEVVPSYITGGKVDYAKIAEDLKAGEFTFADVERVFNGLIDKMNNKADNIVPEVAVEGLTLKTITSNKNEVIMDFENVNYETLKANMDNMFEVTSYNDDLTYGKLEGMYTLTFENANGQELTYKIDVKLD